MGSALYIVAKKKPLEFDMLMDGKALAKAEEDLATVSSRIGVKKLMDFVSMSPEELADILGEEVPNAPPEQWFKAKEGLVVVRALALHLENEPDSVESAARVIEDLKHSERILTYLDQKKILWHFAVDI